MSHHQKWEFSKCCLFPRIEAIIRRLLGNWRRVDHKFTPILRFNTPILGTKSPSYYNTQKIQNGSWSQEGFPLLKKCCLMNRTEEYRANGQQKAHFSKRTKTKQVSIIMTRTRMSKPPDYFVRGLKQKTMPMSHGLAKLQSIVKIYELLNLGWFNISLDYELKIFHVR